MLLFLDCFFFFFQAEDGIRDLTVTGVQTCALPISSGDGGVRRLKHNAEVLAPFGPSATTGSGRYASSPGPEYKASISWRGRSISTPYAETPGSRPNVARVPMRIAYPGRAARPTLAGWAPLDRSASPSMNRPEKKTGDTVTR